MDLASGYSDSFNYGNGYTPLANNAINNNNAAYNANQAYANQVGQYDPFAQSGGFGAQTDYYSGLGRDYTTATGGNIYGGNSFSGWDPYAYGGSSGGIGSDAARAPNQPEIPASFNDRFSAAPQYQPYGPGYFDNTFGSVANTGGTSFAPYQGVQPMTPQQPVQYPQAGGFGSPGFGPYGGSSYTGQPGYGLGVGTMGAPTQSPDYSQQWENWLMSGMRGSQPNPYQNAGMSMQERPDDRQLNELASGQRYRDATNTSPAIDPTQGYANLNPDTTPGWGYKPYNFPTAPAYDAPRQDFGSPDYPALMYDKGDTGSQLLDPNMLNRKQPYESWLNAS